MCGICGIVDHKTDGPIDLALIRQMTDAMRHRGPDEEGVYATGPAGLGMRRLSIIDLAGGHQPILNEDGTAAIVFNGEIYNHNSLREELLPRGHHFRTATDTEVILHIYEEMGAECAKRLNGIFAFAIWDEKRRTLFLARDHLGVKPLYYSLGQNRIVFGSELKAILLHPGVSKEIDREALDDFLTFRYIPAPRTIFQAVRKLPPGHWLTFSEDETRIERYWDVTFAPDRSRHEEEWAREVRELLSDAVKMQLMSEVPLGAFLSGGIDSSIVVGLMSEQMDRPVKTYSVGFKGWPDYDELDFAAIAAKHFQTDHHEIVVDADASALLPKVIAQCDEPMADPAAIPTYLMSRFAREQVTVVLTGEGADEIFAGYGWYRWAKPVGWGKAIQRIPAPLRRAMLPLAQSGLRGRRGKHTMMAMLASNGEERYLETIACSVFQSAERRRLYSHEMREELERKTVSAEMAYYLDRSRDLEPQSQMQYLDTKIWLADDPLTKVDRMSMAVSLEARVPFLDYRLVELAAQIPPELKLRGKTAKYILRQAAHDLLPEAILQREKHAFDVPIDGWLRGELRDWTAGLADHPALSGSGYFDLRYVKELTKEHLGGRRNHGRQIWALLNYAVWHSIYLK